MDRHKLGRERLIEIVKKFKNIKVLVIGDLILDEPVTCQPLGVSQEDSSIIVNSVDNEFS